LKRRIYLSVFALLFLVTIGRAEVIDRIVAVVEGHIITLSDLRQEREVRARLGEQAIDNDADLVRQLVDNYLIERQTAEYPNIDVVNEEVEAELKRSTSRITESEALRDSVRRRIRMQKFFDLKFRQLIRPTDEEIRKYYENVFVPEARARGLQSVTPLSDGEMARGIRENVIQESLDHEVEVWLEAIRRRSNIEVVN